MDTQRTVICQKWLESEAGWGTTPDGYSLHLTEGDRQAFIQEYESQRPSEGPVPDVYDRPDGTPYTCEVDGETYRRVTASKNGIRSYDRDSIPGSGGVDGWIPIGEGQFGRR